MLLEAVLAGWSEREQRMVMYSFNSYGGYAPSDDGGAHYGRITFPDLGDLAPPAIGPFEQWIIPAMQAFRRLMARPGVVCACGGDVYLYELEPHAMSQRLIWSFPDTDRQQAEGAALIGRVLAGEESLRGADMISAAGDGVAAE